jgi:phage/plasmid-associated DNA primase
MNNDSENKKEKVFEGSNKHQSNGKLEIREILNQYIGKFNEIVEFTDILLTLHQFKYIVICPSTGINYSYDIKKGYYKTIGEDHIERLIDKTLLKYGIKFDHKKIKNLYKQMSLKKGVNESETRNTNFICFSNGLYDLESEKLIPHTPEIFCTDNLGFPYLKACPIDNFMKYIDYFCSYNEENKFFLRSWLTLLIYNYPHTQTFLVIVGPGGSGKSLFETICKALVGDNNTITTSLNAMNNDRFEPINFKNKSLVSISLEKFKRTNLSPLKMLTGGDKIAGRIKLNQGSYDFIYEGLIVITSNYELIFDDSSGAIDRRMRVFHSNGSVKQSEQEILLVKDKKGGWKGPISKELPGIFNWALSVGLEEAAKEVKTKFISTNSNSFKMWVDESLQQGRGSFLGYNKKTGSKEMLEASRRGLLFPFYLEWCHKHNVVPESHRMFYATLVKNVPYPVNKIRKREGMYIEGVVLRKEVLERDNIYGGKLLEMPSKVGEIDITDPEK